MSKIMTIIDEENNIEQVEVLNILYLEVTEKNYVFYVEPGEEKNGTVLICTASCEKLDDVRLRIDRRLSNVERKMMKLSLNIMFGLTRD